MNRKKTLTVIGLTAIMATAAAFLHAATPKDPGEGKLRWKQYTREIICADPNSVECDSLVEKKIAADVPGHLDREGLRLTIRTRSGKTIERVSTDHKIYGEKTKNVWACEYLPEYGYIRLCYRLWESALAEYINLRTGESVLVRGFPKYSPSGRSVLFVDGYSGEVRGIQIWRFEQERMVNEFRYRPPPAIHADIGYWKDEKEIVLVSQFNVEVVRHRLVNEKVGWILRDF